MKVLFDTNVVLDVLLNREPHAEPAARLLSLVDTGELEGVICATTVTTVHYVACRARDDATARRCVEQVLHLFDVACVDRPVLLSALRLDFVDFEDAVLHEAALAAGATAIVTRNAKDFAGASLPVFDPSELLAAVLSAE